MSELDENTTNQPSAPEGEALADLLDSCCQWVELSVSRGQQRLAPELKPDRDGRSSPVLTDGINRWNKSVGHGGIRDWIVQGNLRSLQQMREVINDFLDALEKKVRRDRTFPADWKFDNDCLIVLGSRFGLDQPRTFAELRAQQEEQRAADARRQAERDAEFRRKQEEHACSPEGRAFAAKMMRDEFKRDQLRVVMDALFPSVKIECQNILDLTDDERIANRENFARNRAIDDERKTWEKYLHSIVENTNLAASSIVRAFKDAEKVVPTVVKYAEQGWTGKDDFDTIQWEKDFIMKSVTAIAVASLRGNPAPLTKSCVPPVIDGVERVTAAKYADLIPSVEEFLAKGCTLDMRRDFEGLVLTGVPDNLRDQWERHCAEWDEMVMGSNPTRGSRE